MAELFANSGDPDQIQCFSASDLFALFANYYLRGLQRFKEELSEAGDLNFLYMA